MRVVYLGQEGDPDQTTHFGFPFTRNGDAVEVPDDHPNAASFVNNRFFKVTGKGAKDLKEEQAPGDHAMDALQEPPLYPAVADPFIKLDEHSGNPAPVSDRLNPDLE